MKKKELKNIIKIQQEEIDALRREFAVIEAINAIRKTVRKNWCMTEREVWLSCGINDEKMFRHAFNLLLEE